MIRPPGFVMREAIAVWPAARREALMAELEVAADGFEMLLLGARPFNARQLAAAAQAIGVPAAELAALETAFTGFAGSMFPVVPPAGGARRLFAAAEIARRVAALAVEIAELPDLGELVVTPILKGAFIFAADLVRFLSALGLDPLVEFVEISSYQDRHDRAATVERRGLRREQVAGRTVLLVDDICDTGLTFDYLEAAAAGLGAAAVRSCAFIDKPAGRDPHLRHYRPAHIGFAVQPGWIVGYGMDHDGRRRGAPEIGELDRRE